MFAGRVTKLELYVSKPMFLSRLAVFWLRRFRLRIEVFVRVGMAILVRATVNDWLEVEVSMTGRTWRGPLKTICVPWVPAYFFTHEHAGDEIPGEDHLRRNHADGTPCHELVHRQ